MALVHFVCQESFPCYFNIPRNLMLSGEWESLESISLTIAEKAYTQYTIYTERRWMIENSTIIISHGIQTSFDKPWI